MTPSASRPPGTVNHDDAASSFFTYRGGLRRRPTAASQHMGIYYGAAVLAIRYTALASGGASVTFSPDTHGAEWKQAAEAYQAALPDGRYRCEELHDASSTYGPDTWREWLRDVVFERRDGQDTPLTEDPDLV